MAGLLGRISEATRDYSCCHRRRPPRETWAYCTAAETRLELQENDSTEYPAGPAGAVAGNNQESRSRCSKGTPVWKSEAVASEGRMKETLNDIVGVVGKGTDGKAIAGPIPWEESGKCTRFAVAAAAAAVAAAEIAAFGADSGWPASGGSRRDPLTRGLPFSLLRRDCTAAGRIFSGSSREMM